MASNSPGDQLLDDQRNGSSIDSELHTNRYLFKQQTLKAHQPLFEINLCALLFFLSGIVFLIIGSLLLSHHTNLYLMEIDYTDRQCSPTQCRIDFTIPQFVHKPLYMYYQIKGLYQNHRKFLTSRSSEQLLGIINPQDLDKCAPLDFNENNQPYLPCGAMANSVFSDSFELEYNDPETNKTVKVPATDRGIAWPADIERKYGKLTEEAMKNTVKPRNWTVTAKERTSDPFKSDEALMNWMRPAIRSDFRKLYKIVKHEADSLFKDGLPVGNYTLLISGNYPVKPFNGEKAFVIANTGKFGGVSRVYPVLSIVLGCIHLFLGVALCTLPYFHSRKHQLTEEAWAMDQHNVNL